MSAIVYKLRNEAKYQSINEKLKINTEKVSEKSSRDIWFDALKKDSHDERVMGFE